MICQSAKALSLNPLTHPDRITVYHCFYSGITLLQCLAIKPTVLTPRRAHQAISSCLSALAVYTRVLPAVAPFLRIFEDVSNRFVCENHCSEIQPSLKTRNLLNRIVSSDPSEATGYIDHRYLITLSTKRVFTGFYIPSLFIKRVNKLRRLRLQWH